MLPADGGAGEASDESAARDKLTVRGFPFEDEPRLIAEMEDHDLWMTFFREPDRNYLGLMREVRRAGKAPSA